MKQVTKDMIVGDILDIDSSLSQYFLAIGMHCLGCRGSRGKTLEQACEKHGQDLDSLMEKLNAHLANA